MLSTPSFSGGGSFAIRSAMEGSACTRGRCGCDNTMAAVAAKRATETEAVEVDEGESLDEIKAKLKPKKKGGISADMLDTANTYDDKVALVRIIVTDEAGRVANVFKQLMREDLEVLK